jgi:hypothetical protein
MKEKLKDLQVATQLHGILFEEEREKVIKNGKEN